MKRHLLTICAIVSLLASPARTFASNDEAIAQLNLARFVLPEYPANARQAGISEGHVVVALETRRTSASAPTEYLVLRASDVRFVEPVTRAIQGWRFAEPKPGQATPTSVGSGPTVIRFQFLSTGVVSISVPDFQAMRTAATATPQQDNTVMLPTFTDLDHAPKALTQPMPAYPAALRSRPAAGSASVRFFVDTDGRVRLPSVTATTAPEFADAALGVLSQWRFEAPMLNGKAVNAIGTWTFNFGPATR